MSENDFRMLPSVDRIVSDSRLAGLHGNGWLTDTAREALTAARERVAAGQAPPAFDEIVADVARRFEARVEPPLRPIVNATGVILHTNLGRAPLASEAIDAMAAVSAGYSNLEFKMEAGARGSRHDILEPLLCQLTGAEAAIAVNNNASAVLLALSAVASGREVVLSRGQLVEIGGGFRIPDVMRQSRAKLVEVGTTNRTRVEDYADAVSPKTAALMRVHQSNFKIVGFTGTPSLEDIARVARGAGVLLIDDLGSGCLLDTSKYGLAPEPTPQASIAAGADIVMFSGDKLFGGPQAGLVVGRREPLARMKNHPLARAVRLDKASIAGLASTLAIYLREEAEAKLPVWRMIAMPLDAIAARAEAIADRCPADVQTRDAHSTIGGGSLPGETLPTRCVAIQSASGRAATALASRLRSVGIVARIEDDRVLLDPRTVAPEDDERVAGAIRAALA